MKFDPADFMRRMGRRLVHEFEDASQSTTPGLKGAAREHPARKQLERLLPQSAGVGSGIVTDSFGKCSKQQDVVIFERGNCPVFSVNDTPEATFYPCECVVAVGEVKSTLGSTELRDAFEKIASVKALTRFAAEEVGLAGATVASRSYGSVLSLVGTPDGRFDQKSKPIDQVYGFVLCGKSELKPPTLLKKVAELTKEFSPSLSPGAVVSLEDGFFHYCSDDDHKVQLTAQTASKVVYSAQPENAFAFLVQRLAFVVRNGRTVQLSALDRYMFGPTGKRIPISAVCEL